MTSKLPWPGLRDFSRQFACRTVLITASVFLLALLFPGRSCAVTNEILTTAGEILSHPPTAAARSISVSVTGVVTAAEPNWQGKFFVQDSTAGVFVVNTNAPSPVVGDLVLVTGVSSHGGYAPCIEKPHWKKLGTAPLPEARTVSLEQFMSGAEDGRRIELEGTVISAQPSQIVNDRLRLDLKCGSSRFRAFMPLPVDMSPDSLVGASVRIRGTAASSFSQSLRYLFSVFVFMPQTSDLIVDRAPNPAIFSEPFTPLNGIARYHGDDLADERIRVKGVVTCQRLGEDIFLHDSSGGLRMEYYGTNVFAPGAMVEAVGFPGVEGFLPVLENATVIRSRESAPPLVPRNVSIFDLLKSVHHADLVSLQGVLLDRSLRPGQTAYPLTDGNQENILTLKSDRYFFSVETPASGPFAALGSIPIGSTLRVSGVCLLKAGEHGNIEDIQIMPLDATGVRILQRPGWWTPRRLLIALAILLAMFVAGTVWVVTMLRKNNLLKVTIAEKIRAQVELQKAHDLLETRVRERTREWKVEMGARKKAEIILSERTRLAQELHDTLLQGFTGIGLKMEAFCNHLPPDLATSKQQMQKILKQSDEYLDEARRSIWQLRSPSLEVAGNFSDALRKVSLRAIDGTDIRFQFVTIGDHCEPGEVVADNLLRICEEAVTNAVRHANPGTIEVTFETDSTGWRLRVRDDGCGFNPGQSNGSKDGHFGLVGLRERAKTIAGELSLNSGPGRGTEVLITVPWPLEP